MTQFRQLILDLNMQCLILYVQVISPESALFKNEKPFININEALRYFLALNF